MTLKQGELVGVPCSIQPGPFADEHFVAAETADGTICGFVREENLKIDDGERGYIASTVISDNNSSILVRMFGSFFTTAMGLATVSRSGLLRLSPQ